MLAQKEPPTQSLSVVPKVIGQNNVAVPTHFFKVVVGETGSGDLEMEAYVMPNEAIPDSAPLVSFQVSDLLLLLLLLSLAVGPVRNLRHWETSCS